MKREAEKLESPQLLFRMRIQVVVVASNGGKKE
jgi:hypothetical protein